MAANLLQKAVPILRRCTPPRVSAVRFVTWKSLFSIFNPNDETQLQDKVKVKVKNISNGDENETEYTTSFTSNKSSSFSSQLIANRDNQQSEDGMYQDIQPTISLVKEILHSDRYSDGEPLLAEDEKVVVEKLLPYHPDSEDKIGPGIDFIMVDRHPVYRQSRCLFVVHTDGGLIDFSYHMCLKAYLREKYPSYAESFIQKHFTGRRLRM